MGNVGARGHSTTSQLEALPSHQIILSQFTLEQNYVIGKGILSQDVHIHRMWGNRDTARSTKESWHRQLKVILMHPVHFLSWSPGRAEPAVLRTKAV